MSYRITGKSFLSFIMAALIAFSMMIVPVAAVNEEEIGEQIENANSSAVSPLWDNVNTPNLALTFSNKKIYAKITVSGIAGTKYKNGTVTISKYNGDKYVTVKKWTGLSSSKTTFSFVSSGELSATSGVKYKLSISITAYTSSKSEAIKTSKVSTCP